MCGIAGVKRFDGRPIEPRLLVAMGERLAHRGPDDSGQWASATTGFAHTRLSIIDVAGSVQPMASCDGRLHLCFNGEIYNYRELRAGLEYPFTTSGDTETLLACFRTHGRDGLKDVQGQFAFAMHDASDDSLTLVRDRLGILPLYYYSDSRVFAFASEVKALLLALPSHPAVNEDVLAD